MQEHEGTDITIIGVYVDDLIVIGTDVTKGSVVQTSDDERVRNE